MEHINNIRKSGIDPSDVDAGQYTSVAPHVNKFALALGDVLDIVDQWQRKGRIGYCLPVLRDDLLERLEALADERRRDGCTMCHGTGAISDGYDDWDCKHCEPLAGK